MHKLEKEIKAAVENLLLIKVLRFSGQVENTERYRRLLLSSHTRVLNPSVPISQCYLHQTFEYFRFQIVRSNIEVLQLWLQKR